MVPSFPCMSFLSLPIFSWLLWDEIYIQLIGFVLNDSHRLKIGFSSCVKVATLWRCPVLTWIPQSQPKPSGYSICPVEFSGSGVSNLKLRYGLFFLSMLCTERMSVVLVKAHYYHNFRPFVLLKYLRETWKLQDDKLSRSRKRKRKKRVGKNQASWSLSRRRRRRSYLPFTFHRNRVHSSVGFTHSLTSSGSPW